MADSEHNSSPASAGPVTRRRGGKRTARACDECRMRKAKCDGLSPCESCRNADRHCTYNLSAGRSTGSGTRIRILEDRLRRARAYLHEAQKRAPSLQGINFDALLEPNEPEDVPMADNKSNDTGSEDNSNKLDSMMDSYGQLNMDVRGSMEREFYGAASGLAWIQRADRLLDQRDDKNRSPSPAQQPEPNMSATVQIFDAPLPRRQSFSGGLSVDDLLPSREVAERMVHTIFSQVYPLFHFLDEQSFHESMSQLYSKSLENYDEDDQTFFSLFCAVIGLGYLFSRQEHDGLGCRKAIWEGMRYFVVARNMLDIAHLRTLVSLQSVICLILFLISTARIASGHAFVGVACAAAMRQGLHYRSTHELSLPQKERKIRRRVFWAVMNLDMYVGGILGLPYFIDLSASDPAIELTIELALKDVQRQSSLVAFEDFALAASAKHIELMRIFSKAQLTLFPGPPDPPDATIQHGTIAISSVKLQEIEDQFRVWASSMREILTFSGQTEGVISIKYELQMAYYFSQIRLYRPFLHYLNQKQDKEPYTPGQMSYAHTCVRMASKAVGVSVEHQQEGLLCPASWPAIYTIFISAVCMVFSLATNSDGTDRARMRQEVEKSVRLLACTACTTDTGSVRCLEILRRLIKKVDGKVGVDFDAIASSTRPYCRITSPSIRGDEGPKFGTQDHSTRPDDRSRSQSQGVQRPAEERIQENVQATGSSSSLRGVDDTSAFSPFSNMNTSSFASNDQDFHPRYDLYQPYPRHSRSPEETLHMFQVYQFHRPEFNNALDLSSNLPYGSENYDTSGSESIASGNSGLSSEEVAHFMHINPGDYPFPYHTGQMTDLLRDSRTY